MPYQQRINLTSLDRNTQAAIAKEFDALRAELDDIRAKYAALQTALNAGTVIGAAGYPNSTMALGGKTFTAL